MDQHKEERQVASLLSGADADEPLMSATEPRTRTLPGVLYHILIVDDDPVNRRVLRNHLLLNNYSVTEAQNGRAALDIFDKSISFDLILLDVMMPGLSGYEVCRILRKTHSDSELPVIMLTAKNRVSDLVTGLESGANDYLTKPFDSRELLTRVHTMIRLKGAAKSQSDLAMLKNAMDMAREIQQSLIPVRMPEIEVQGTNGRPEVSRIRLNACYRAMESVGGDFYDFLNLGRRQARNSHSGCVRTRDVSRSDCIHVEDSISFSERVRRLSRCTSYQNQ